MENNIKIELTNEIVKDLEVFSKILEKSPSKIINEALNQYFEQEQEKLNAAQALDMDNGMSNLDFNEFWEDVDI